MPTYYQEQLLSWFCLELRDIATWCSADIHPQGSQHSAWVLAEPLLHADPAVLTLAQGGGRVRLCIMFPSDMALKCSCHLNFLFLKTLSFSICRDLNFPSFVWADVKSKYVIAPIKHNEKWIESLYWCLGELPGMAQLSLPLGLSAAAGHWW